MDDLVIDKIVGYFPIHFFTVRCFIEYVNAWDSDGVTESHTFRIFNKTFYFRSIDMVNTTILAFYSKYCPTFLVPILLTEEDFAINMKQGYIHKIPQDEYNKYVYGIQVNKSKFNNDIPIFDHNYFGL